MFVIKSSKLIVSEKVLISLSFGALLSKTTKHCKQPSLIAGIFVSELKPITYHCEKLSSLCCLLSV